MVGNSEGVEVSFKAKAYKNMNLKVSIGLHVGVLTIKIRKTGIRYYL